MAPADSCRYAGMLRDDISIPAGHPLRIGARAPVEHLLCIDMRAPGGSRYGLCIAASFDQMDVHCDHDVPRFVLSWKGLKTDHMERNR